MTDEQLLDWGRKEHELRIVDLKNKTEAGLKAAQDNAEKRRRSAGLTKSQAAAAVRATGTERRRNTQNMP